MKTSSSIALIATLLTTGMTTAEGDVSDHLRERVIPAELPLAEVQSFCEARVARLPDVGSIEEWESHARRIRRDVLDRVVLRGDARAWAQQPTRVVWLESIEKFSDYRIRRLRFEAVPGLWVPALLYEPRELRAKVPVVLNVNGHDGKGKAAPYKQIRCIHQAKQGLIALNVEWLGMGQLRSDGFNHYRMNQLDLCGTSGLAPFYLSMTRGLDILLEHPNADPDRVAVAGLSGGGWQTIVISALDERVTLANPVAGYSSYRTRVHFPSDLGDSEQTPSDLAAIADYTHLTALRAPRPTLLTYNAKDQCCFRADHALAPLLEAAEPIYALYGVADRLRSHVNDDPGTHNFDLDNRRAFGAAIRDYLVSDGESFDSAEGNAAAEVLSAEELHVDIPDDNADFHRLAQKIAGTLPATKRSLDSPAAIAAARERLWALTRAKRYEVAATDIGGTNGDGVRAKRWRLQMGGEWTVPATELSAVGSVARETVIVLADRGRGDETVAEAAKSIIGAEKRVLAIDPFYFGESKITSRDFLYAILVSSVGERPLGIQASQVGATARWLKTRYPGEPVRVSAIGPRASLIATVAAALERDAIDRLDVREPLGSLREIIDRNWAVNQQPEAFCFGLLAEFELETISALGRR